jgi:hypothetical protein
MSWIKILSRSGMESAESGYESEDLYLYKNLTDPEHWRREKQRNLSTIIVGLGKM